MCTALVFLFALSFFSAVYMINVNYASCVAHLAAMRAAMLAVLTSIGLTCVNAMLSGPRLYESAYNINSKHIVALGQHNNLFCI